MSYEILIIDQGVACFACGRCCMWRLWRWSCRMRFPLISASMSPTGTEGWIRAPRRAAASCLFWWPCRCGYLC